MEARRLLDLSDTLITLSLVRRSLMHAFVRPKVAFTQDGQLPYPQGVHGLAVLAPLAAPDLLGGDVRPLQVRGEDVGDPAGLSEVSA